MESSEACSEVQMAGNGHKRSSLLVRKSSQVTASRRKSSQALASRSHTDRTDRYPVALSARGSLLIANDRIWSLLLGNGSLVCR